MARSGARLAQVKDYQHVGRKMSGATADRPTTTGRVCRRRRHQSLCLATMLVVIGGRGVWWYLLEKGLQSQRSAKLTTLPVPVGRGEREKRLSRPWCPFTGHPSYRSFWPSSSVYFRRVFSPGGGKLLHNNLFRVQDASSAHSSSCRSIRKCQNSSLRLQ